MYKTTYIILVPKRLYYLLHSLTSYKLQFSTKKITVKMPNIKLFKISRSSW